MKNTSLEELEGRIGYAFRDKSLLSTAMTHSSYINEHNREGLVHNERMEFLGDAVLELVSSDFIYRNYPESSEGRMTKLRASLVCEPALAQCARQISIGPCLKMGKGESAGGGRERDSILSDALEALIGAVFLDGGIESASAFIERFVLCDIEHKDLYFDSKTMLQEMVQEKGLEITYKIIGEEGPDHAKVFCAAAYIDGVMAAKGSGRTKKAAEQSAAYEAILGLREKE